MIENSSGIPQLIRTCEMKRLPKALTAYWSATCISPPDGRFATSLIPPRLVIGSASIAHFIFPDIFKVPLKSTSHLMEIWRLPSCVHWHTNGKETLLRHKDAYSCSDESAELVAAVDKISSLWSQRYCIYRWSTTQRKPGTHTHTDTTHAHMCSLFCYVISLESNLMRSLWLVSRCFPIPSHKRPLCGENLSWLSSLNRLSRLMKLESPKQKY